MNIKLNINQIKEIKIGERGYPEKLLHIYSAPKVLYVLGNEKILNERSIAIIGCRNCTEYGKKVSSYFAREFAKRGINVISGLARGIDTFAHEGTISTLKTFKSYSRSNEKNISDKINGEKNKKIDKEINQSKNEKKENFGKTIAVLGCGLDVIYPAENIELYKEIIKTGGTIITEYPLGTQPLKQHFPARNRIISGLSDGVLVVEAKERSGTMITVEHTLEQGKDVYAVPRKYI